MNFSMGPQKSIHPEPFGRPDAKVWYPNSYEISLTCAICEYKDHDFHGYHCQADGTSMTKALEQTVTGHMTIVSVEVQCIRINCRKSEQSPKGVKTESCDLLVDEPETKEALVCQTLEPKDLEGTSQGSLLAYKEVHRSNVKGFHSRYPQTFAPVSFCLDLAIPNSRAYLLCMQI